MKRLRSIIIIFLVVTGLCFSAEADTAEEKQQQSTSHTQKPITSRQVIIWSDGTRLSGDLFYPDDANPDNPLPAIILCHGWGGVKKDLNKTYAPRFAEAGYVVLTFDYRGWGDSDSRLIRKETTVKEKKIVQARAVRMVVDPYDQIEDIINSIHFMNGEPIVDSKRIGLWGSSFGGGHVLYVATHDDRIQCIVSQVPSMDSRGMPKYLNRSPRVEEIRRARGEIEPVPQRSPVLGLPGTPYISKMATYAPIQFAEHLNIPMLVIAAEREHLVNNKTHGFLAYSRARDNNIPARYELIKGATHFEVYSKYLNQSIRLALDWFDRYLKNTPR